MTILAFSVGAVVGCVVGVVVMALLAVSRGSWDGTLRLIHPGKKQPQTENGD
jgi:hypothetical protein